mgnify:CR=1 FL=1|jgi:hypothetical protein|nr:MAG TPA: hypothetical protein [Caudoviricetes sp.]
MSKLQIPQWEKREKIYVECEEVDDRTAISPIKAAACEVACGMHLLAFLASACIFVNTSFNISTLLFTLYCAFGAFWFGSTASSIGGLDEE